MVTSRTLNLLYVGQKNNGKILVRSLLYILNYIQVVYQGGCTKRSLKLLLLRVTWHAMGLLKFQGRHILVFYAIDVF